MLRIWLQTVLVYPRKIMMSFDFFQFLRIFHGALNVGLFPIFAILNGVYGHNWMEKLDKGREMSN